LTKGKSYVTDASNASRTLLFNINTGQWDSELMEIFGISPTCLPEVKSSSDDFGIFTSGNWNIPINGVAGDQQAALFGQCCFEKGSAKNTYGTGCFMLMNTGENKISSKNGLLTTVAWQIDGKITYAIEGSVFVAGSAIQWLRDGLQIIEQAEASEKLALEANPESEVFVVPAFAGLGAPYWDMYARGGILGLTRDSGIAEITKATLDSLAYQTKDVLDAMVKDAEIPITSLQVDGGACANNYLMQFQSDLLRIKIDRPECKESTALGVAFLAGIKAGVWTMNQLPSIRKTERVFDTLMNEEEAHSKYEKWSKAVISIRKWSE
jgi:glycerol kinase